MAKRTYTQVQAMLPEIRELIAAGKTQREIAEYYGFSSKTVIKQLLNRERKRAQKEAAGIVIRPKGRPRKGDLSRDIVAEQQYEINHLKMENKLLRDFLRSTERK